MIIKFNWTSAERIKPLFLVAMVAKFLDLNTTVCSVLQTWYETTNKIDLYDFPLHDCIQEQSGNKTGHRNNTATKWPDKPLWGTCAYREHQRMGYFYSGFRTADPRYKRRATWSETRHTPLRLLRFSLTERIVFLTWKKRHFWLEVAFCFLPHKWKYRSLHLYWLAITHLRVAWDSHAHANELLRKWPTFCDVITRTVSPRNDVWSGTSVA